MPGKEKDFVKDVLSRTPGRNQPKPAPSETITKGPKTSPKKKMAARFLREGHETGKVSRPLFKEEEGEAAGLKPVLTPRLGHPLQESFGLFAQSVFVEMEKSRRDRQDLEDRATKMKADYEAQLTVLKIRAESVESRLVQVNESLVQANESLDAFYLYGRALDQFLLGSPDPHLRNRNCALKRKYRVCFPESE